MQQSGRWSGRGRSGETEAQGGETTEGGQQRDRKQDIGKSSGTHLHDREEDDVHLSVCNYGEQEYGPRR